MHIKEAYAVGARIAAQQAGIKLAWLEKLPFAEKMPFLSKATRRAAALRSRAAREAKRYARGEKILKKLEEDAELAGYYFNYPTHKWRNELDEINHQYYNWIRDGGK